MKFKQWLAGFLAICLLLVGMPVASFATSDIPNTPPLEVNEKISIDEKWIQEKVDEIAQVYKVKQKKNGKLTDWWEIIELAKYEQLQGTYSSNTFTEGTKQWVKRQTIGNTTQKPNTDVNSLTKNILAIRSMGYDPENYYGFNLVELLASRDNFGTDVNALGPALNALSSDDYTNSPSLTSAVNMIKQQILQAQNEDYLWAGYGLPWDITGFALYALAPYYQEEAVQSKLNQTFQAIGKNMMPSGDLTDHPGNANSLEMIIGGIVSCNGKLLAEDDLVKNNNTLLDGLKLYDTKGGFVWKIGDHDANSMATEQGFRALLAYLSNKDGNGGVFDFRGLDKQAAEVKSNSVDEYRDWLTSKFEESAKSIQSRPNDQSPILYPGLIRNGVGISENEIIQMADKQKSQPENRRYAIDLAQVILNLRIIGKNPEDYKGTNFLDQLVKLPASKFRRVEEIEASIYALTSDDYSTANTDQKLNELIDLLLQKKDKSNNLWENFGDWQEDTGRAISALSSIIRTNPSHPRAQEIKNVIDETVQIIAKKQLQNGDFTEETWMGEGSIANFGSLLKGLVQVDAKNLTDEKFQKSEQNLLDVLKVYDVVGGQFADTRNGKETGYELPSVQEALSVILWTLDHNEFIYDFRKIPMEGAPTIDKSALIQAINEAKREENGVYISEDGKTVLTTDFYITPEQSKAFKDVLAQAESINENPQATKDEIEHLTNQLHEAVEKLKENKKPGLKMPVNKTELKEAIQNAQIIQKNISIGKDASEFLQGVKFAPKEVFDTLNEILNRAIELDKNENATQEEVNHIIEQLHQGIENFKSKIGTGTKDAVDRVQLGKVLEKIKQESQAYPVSDDPQKVSYNQPFTTSENKEILEKVIKKAQDLYDDPTASKAEGDQMIQELEKSLQVFKNNLVIGKQLQDGVYFQKDSGEIILMDENKTFKLSALDQGRFILKAKDPQPDWQAEEKIVIDEFARKTHYWIATDGRFNPRVVKTIDAKVINMAQVSEKYDFKIQQIPSNIEELKILVDGKEVSTANPIKMQGSAPKRIVVQGRSKGSQEFYTLPYQAVAHDASGQGGNTGGQLGKRIDPNWNFQISSEPITYEIFLKENPNIKASFTAEPSQVPVKDFQIRVPQKAYIHAWNGIFGDYFVGVQRGTGPNEYMESFTPTNATNRGLNWEALTPDIAEYMEEHKNGIVPKKAGIAKFKVTSQDNPEISKVIEIEFAYKNPLKKASIEDNVIRMKKGDTIRLNIETIPQDASEKRFYWTFDQDEIIKIKQNVTNDPNSVLIPKQTTHSITAYKDGVVQVKGIPYDQTGGAEPIEFTVLVGEVQLPVDKSDLKKSLNSAKEIKLADVIDKDGKNVEPSKTWVMPEIDQALKDAIIKAEKVFENSKASQEEVDNALSALNTAITSYNPQTGTKADTVTPPVVNKGELTETINVAKAHIVASSINGRDIDPSKTWTSPEDLNLFLTAITKAETVFRDPAAHQAQIDQAIKDLAVAIQNYDAMKRIGSKESPRWNDGYVPAFRPTITRPNPVKPETKSEVKPDVQPQPIPHFIDTPGHWAEDVINYVVEKGYFKGTGPDTFSPNRTSTRAELITVLGRIAGINPNDYKTSALPDIQSGTFYDGYANWAVSVGIIKGNERGEFEPNREITREEVAAILARYFAYIGKNKPASGQHTYNDQNDISPWARDAVNQLTEAGILKGQGQNTFAPQKDITRAEIAQLIYNMDQKAMLK